MKNSILVVGIILLLSTVNIFSQSATTADIKNLQEQINELKAKNVSLEKEIATLKDLLSIVAKNSTSNNQKIDSSAVKKPTGSKQGKSVEETKSYSGGGQCQATTKKGTRCSRSAGPNGYCWQHSK